MAKAASPKWGAGSFSAWMRQGLKELRAALYPDSPIAREAEMGMYGTVTPSEVVAQRNPDKEKHPMQAHDPHQSIPEPQQESRSIVDDRIQQSREQAQPEPQQEKEQERE
jgi:hypothetical protein